ncbi:uncharacterized protein PGRI_088570 [Penicillium griseofulvum]|uniref:Glycosyltransferase, DXD sugar-binding motif n=1 Tax=Penicillium patulum TaxID=5078 RepID=A0A135LUA7_PENPA|nr:uncharacterized protein PGRI_088570 [Penicillium griseofulvum]KXG52573.1 hypothetical protein PGRI_088570 [Penicillium griseofulvum]
MKATITATPATPPTTTPAIHTLLELAVVGAAGGVELLTDRSAEAFVRAHYFETRPDIVEVYEALPIAILRADLFRYLVVLAEGGIWGDLDTSCEKEVSEWVLEEYRNENIDMIVGLEFDFEWRGPETEVASQFCNWIFVARKSSRNLQIVVDTVVKTLKDIAQKNSVGIEGITLEMLSDVVNVTGPKNMTITLMDSLQQLLGRPVDDRDYAHTKRLKLVGDVFVMPGAAFAALQNGNRTDQGDVLVTHYYEGSWKKEDVEAKGRKKTETRAREVETRTTATVTTATTAGTAATIITTTYCDLKRTSEGHLVAIPN